jgi:hypothetical protein
MMTAFWESAMLRLHAQQPLFDNSLTLESVKRGREISVKPVLCT